MSGSRLVELLRDNLVLQPGNTGFLYGRDDELEKEMLRLSIYPVRNEIVALDFIAMEVFDPYTLLSTFALLRNGCVGVIKIDEYTKKRLVMLMDAWKDLGVLTWEIEEPYIVFMKKRKPDEIKS